MPLTPPQRKSADPKLEPKQAENAPSSSQVLPRPTASKAQLAQVARSSSNELAPAETQPVDEQFLRDLMSANLSLADVESQLELQLEGRTAVDHIPDGLSTLSQYLLYRQQLLERGVGGVGGAGRGGIRAGAGRGRAGAGGASRGRCRAGPGGRAGARCAGVRACGCAGVRVCGLAGVRACTAFVHLLVRCLSLSLSPSLSSLFLTSCLALF